MNISTLGRSNVIIAFVILVAMVLALPLAGTARAEQAETETEEVRLLLVEAVSEYEARRFEEARALFRRAHQLSPSARALRGIGMASFELRDYVQALQSLESSLVETRRALTPEQRRHVERLITRTNAYLGRFVINLSPAKATLRVDGQTAPLSSGSVLMLGFGTHTISADAPGFAAQSRELTVMGGERSDLSFELHASDAGETTLPLPSVDERGGNRGNAPMLSVSGSQQAARSNAVFWFVGAGALAVGAVAGGLWAYQLSGELERCRDAGAACLNEETLTNRRNVAVGLTIGLTTGAAAVAVIGSIVGLRKPQSGSGTALACAPGPGTVHCAFTF